MTQYAIVDTASNSVANLVDYESAPTGAPPGFGATCIAVPVPAGAAGNWANWSWNGTILSIPATAAPTLPVVLTFLQFMALFTAAEQDAIVASTDTQTRLFLLMATGAGVIALANPEVITGVNYLATLPGASPPGPGLIASSRPAQILAGQAPS